MVPLRLLLNNSLPWLPEGGAKDFITQAISDYVAIDVSGMLSERLTAQYMYDHMGGLDGPEDADLEELKNVEAYNIEIPSDKKTIVVDRRSNYNKDMTWEQYRSSDVIEKDGKLVETALRKWFADVLCSSSRVAGSDPDEVVQKVVNDNIRFRFHQHCITLKYGIVHCHYDFPSLYTAPQKRMHVEFYARLTNVPNTLFNRNREDPRRPEYPYHHTWEYEELHFEVRAATYSDQRYLMVHMPGYG